MGEMNRFVEMLQHYVSIPSLEGIPKVGMPFGESVDDALQFMLMCGDEFGFTVKNLDGYVGLIEYGDAEESIGILVHCDVVPAGNGWSQEPYKLVQKDGRLYGRGIIDNKGPAMACLYAMKRLKDAGIKPRRKVQMIIGTDEETLWRDMSRYVNYEILPVLSFTPDGSFPLIHAEKGILDFDLVCTNMDLFMNDGIELIEISGGQSRNSVADACVFTFKCDMHHTERLINAFEEQVGKGGIQYESAWSDGECRIKVNGKSCHAMHPEQGVNAIAHGLCALERLSGVTGGAIAEFRSRIGLDIHGSLLGCEYSDELSGKLTLNIGLISYVDNTLRMQFNARYPVTTAPEEVLESFKNAFTISNFQYDLIDHVKPLYVPQHNPMVGLLMDIYQKHTGDLETKPLVIGGATYARVLPNTVAFGPLLPWQEEVAHEANEYVEEDHLYRLIDIYEEAIVRLASLEMV